ncbi:MAG: hypothetical protein EOO26_07595 [Comamonadaceae bacterium]|nr:MAG: hypothetical protein EOO26_07595 [Comamonadaceae bacterium]
MDDLDAAAMLFGHVLGLPSLASAAEGEIRFGLGARWLALAHTPAEQVDCLHWHCAALAGQRLLLVQLGIETVDETSDSLQASGVDTGACAAIWTEAPHAASTDPTLRLHALVLNARAPERVASHWAQMLNAAPGRDAGGMPQLRTDGVSLGFAFSEDGAGGVREITLALDGPESVQRVCQRADAAGVARDGDTLSLGGLTVRLV